MDWTGLQGKMPRDNDFPARAFRIGSLSRVLDGTLYDHLTTAFSEEESASGEYVPLDQRRPSVRSGLCRTVVDDSVSLLFSEGHWPEFRSDDEATAQALSDLSKQRRLSELFVQAATTGSVGSVAILFQVLKQRPYFRVMSTVFLTPAWNPEEPDELVSVTERYKVSATDLNAQGYQVDPLAGMHWFQRIWDTEAETWFAPWPVSSAKSFIPVVDEARTVRHALGFVPVVWIRNLPSADDVDGGCTFQAGISTMIEVDYSLSQAGRALKYAGDPKLVVRDASGENKPVKGGAANALFLSDPESEAKFLEINGTAAAAVKDHVTYLRGLALEAMHGMRADSERMSAATSGRALEILHQPLIWLADKLRTSYGEGGLLSLLKMVCRASSAVGGGILINGLAYTDLNPEGLSLVWSRWFAPTAEDRQADASTSQMLVDAGVLSRETALRNLAADYDIEDVEAEMALVAKETAAADARAAALSAQVKASEQLPS